MWYAGGGRRIVYGTDDGVYISDLRDISKDPVKVLGLLDDADQAVVARGVGADVTRVLLGQIEADRAVVDPRLDVPHCVGELERHLRPLLEQVERDALGRPHPDAREARELVHEVLDRLGVGGHGGADYRRSGAK